MDAAYLHVLGDMIMSIGVVIAATVIYIEPTWTIIDPLCTYLFSLIVCVTVTPVVKLCISVLMEGSPSEIDSVSLVKDIEKSKGVLNLHDFHLW